MKPLKISLFLAAAVLFITLSACGEAQNQPAQETQEEVLAPEQIVSIESARAMYKNYSERRVPLIQRYEDSINDSTKDTTRFDVARYTYYDYNTIKQYLAYIEQEAAKAGVEISTLRFYYSNYADMQKFEDGKPVVHPRQNSFFIIPAVEKDGDSYAFTTEVSSEGETRAVLLNWELDPVNPKEMGGLEESGQKAYAGFGATTTNTAMFGNGGTALNHGSAAPPPYK